METYPHIYPDLRSYMAGTDAERIRESARDRFIPYARADQILTALQALLDYPSTLRPEHVLIVGDSSNGKSAILNEFRKRNAVRIDTTGAPICPIISIEVPPRPTETFLYSLIIGACGVSHNSGMRVSDKHLHVLRCLQQCSARVLVIDEFANIGNAKGNEATILLDAIRSISNQLRLSIVSAGVRSSINVVNYNSHMVTRFVPYHLPPWEYDDDYRTFLLTYEQLLLLREPSGISDDDLSATIYRMCDKNIGSTVRLLMKAAAHAITTGTERITIELLKTMPYVGPRAVDTLTRHFRESPPEVPA
ncbi:MAG: TniB family NTP-binding protein [Planctomycetes bacterium]|nr:TniB family NTP-binding protein [Planctomycetota bacterium]